MLCDIWPSIGEGEREEGEKEGGSAEGEREGKEGERARRREGKRAITRFNKI